MENPERTVPIAVLVATIGVALIYIALNYTISKIAVLVEKRLQNRGQAAGAGEHGDGPGAGVTAGVAVTGAPGVNFGEQHTT